jgi:hypothetical protein
MLLFVIALAALTLTPVVAAAAPATPKFNAEFTFEGVTFANPGGGETTDGVIYAGSKTTGGGNTTTVCDYASADGVESLGQFQRAVFASNDPDAVLAFCVENAVNRAP